jgi:hypothetical protein
MLLARVLLIVLFMNRHWRYPQTKAFYHWVPRQSADITSAWV